MKKEITLNDIMTALQDFIAVVNERFTKIDKRFDELETTLNDRFEKLESRVGNLETTMNNRFDLNTKVPW